MYLRRVYEKKNLSGVNVDSGTVDKEDFKSSDMQVWGLAVPAAFYALQQTADNRAHTEWKALSHDAQRFLLSACLGNARKKGGRKKLPTNAAAAPPVHHPTASVHTQKGSEEQIRFFPGKAS